MTLKITHVFVVSCAMYKSEFITLTYRAASMKNSPFILSLLLFLIIAFPNNSFAETKFKLGQTYSGFIQLDGDSKDMQIPLPPGSWELSGLQVKDPTSQNTVFVVVYLHQEIDKKAKEFIRFQYAYENNSNGWKAPFKPCRNERNLFAEENAMYSGTQSDCWTVSASRVAATKAGAGRDQIKYLQSKNIKMPRVAPSATYFRFDRSEFYIVRYTRNPVFYGLADSTDTGLHSNDYSQDRIGEFPKKKAFADEFINWAKSWKKYIDLGFEGKLTSEMMGKPIAKKAEPKKKSSGTGIEAKLKKLKSLVDKGLITPEDAAAKRKEILDNM